MKNHSSGLSAIWPFISRAREINNELAGQGWSVLRFTGTQIRENLPDYL
ncbi:MAG: hypothetical protein V1789_02125 [PVC group bacterium]